MRLPHYDIRNHTGYLTKSAGSPYTTGEIMVNIVVGYEDKKYVLPCLNFIHEQIS